MKIEIKIVAGDTPYAGPIKLDTGQVHVTGNVTGSIGTMSGDVTVEGDITANVSTMSGDVNVEGNIQGQTSTMSGDIKTRGCAPAPRQAHRVRDTHLKIESVDDH